jgi:hypothetical protein
LLKLPDDPQAAALVRRVQARQQAAVAAAAPSLPALTESAAPELPAEAAGPLISVVPERVRTERVREAGPLPCCPETRPGARLEATMGSPMQSAETARLALVGVCSGQTDRGLGSQLAQ